MNSLYKYSFEDDDGMQNMQDVLKMFRYGFKTIGNIEVERVLDHSNGTDGATGSEIIEYRLVDGSSIEIRPSGAGPEVKVCISVANVNDKKAACIETQIREDIESILYLNYRAGYCCE